MTSSLYSSINKDAAEIDHFTSSAKQLLERQVKSVDEFSETNSGFNEILRLTPEVLRRLIIFFSKKFIRIFLEMIGLNLLVFLSGGANYEKGRK